MLRFAMLRPPCNDSPRYVRKETTPIRVIVSIARGDSTQHSDDKKTMQCRGSKAEMTGICVLQRRGKDRIANNPGGLRLAGCRYR